MPHRRTTYLDPQTGLLRNCLGATTAAVLHAAEHDLVIVRQIQLGEHPIDGTFDLPHLQAIHRQLFGDVYPFAGCLRTVDICRVDYPGGHFMPARLLSEAAAHVFGNIAADDYLRGLGRARFVDRLTEHFVAINHLHPFREGNGRTQRIFLADLAARAGHRLDWTAITRAQDLAASRCPAAEARHLIDLVTQPRNH
jgi:cell filamentation protein